MDGWLDGWMDGLMNGWVDGRMVVRWMDMIEWMDGKIKILYSSLNSGFENIHFHFSYLSKYSGTNHVDLENNYY